MSCRAGIVVTGTEVLTGRVTDRNGPWVVERLRELGIDAAHIAVVGDRPDDISGALRFFAAEGLDLVVTSGGLGPTADDLTATVVGEFQGRAMVLDAALEERIAEILRPFAARRPDLDPEALRESGRKQAVVPVGATILEPVGTAPGLVVPPADADADAGGAGPTIVVLPGPPRELQPMWEAAVATDAFTAATGGRTRYVQHMLRLFGTPESEIAQTLRRAQADGIDVEALEVTTCQRRAELEIVTRYEEQDADTYAALVHTIRTRHAGALFSDDGSSVDEQVAALLRERGLRVATAESCTGGLICGRLTDLAGSSEYVVGGLVTYADAAKTALAGVDPGLIAAHGAVSEPVAEAMAAGALARLDADIAVAVTGIAGPGGGSEAKPVGTVVFAVTTCDDAPVLTVTQVLPGRRTDVRDWSTTVALHLLRRVLRGEGIPITGGPRA